MNGPIRAAALMGAVLALAACAGGEPAPDARLGPDYGFHFHQDDESATLAYGRANSDDVGLVLQCDLGSHLVTVSDVVRVGRPDTLHLASGSSRAALRIESAPDPSGLPLAQARADLDLPALREFQRTGRIAVALGDVRYGVSATPVERTAVQRFFEACSKT